MWFFSYTVVRSRGHERPPEVTIGHFVTEEHPLAVVDRWNRQSADAAAGFGRGRHVISHYARLSPEELETLRSASIDPTAIDVSVSTVR